MYGRRVFCAACQQGGVESSRVEPSRAEGEAREATDVGERGSLSDTSAL